MGWRAKVAGLLHDTLEAPLKIYTYAGSLVPAGHASQEISQDQNQQAQPQTVDIEEESEDFGPDTTSLTAFLLSLLSSSDTSRPRLVLHDSLETSIESKNDIESASTSNLHDVHSECFSDNLPLADTLTESPEQISNASMDSVSKYFHEAHDDSKVLVLRQNFQDDELKLLDETKAYSRKLPAMSEDSVLFSDDFRAFLYRALPNLVKGRLWVLLYSTARHGISLHTLYRRSAALPGPFLLVVGDFHGAIFGGLVTTPLKPSSKRKYNGSDEMFVFTNVHGNPNLFRATGVNRYYCLCTNDALALGGGDHFALYLDEELLNGSSGVCDTFGNTCLAYTEHFSIVNVEIWGFSHMSRYAALLQGEMK